MTKKKLLTVKVDESVLRDFQIVARIRGQTMSALVLQFVLLSIREHKSRQPHLFPDYEPPPKIIGESEFGEMLMEALDGKELTPEKRRAIEIAVRTALEVQELTKDGTEIEK